jgi:copper transport protein
MTTSHVLAAALIRWVALLATAAAIGGLAVEVLVLPRDAPERGGVGRRLRRWSRGASVILVFATAGELLARAQTMSGGALWAAVGATPAVLAHTHFGAVWIVRLVLLGGVLAATLLRSRGGAAGALLLTCGVALTTSLTGHAGTWGNLSASVVVDWAHAVASAAWTGGLMALALVVLAHHPELTPVTLGRLARRFSRLAGACLLVVLLSGGYNAWVQLARLSALWTTVYGRVLVTKLLVVLGLVWLGGVSRYLILPRLDPGLCVEGLGARAFRLARLGVLGPSQSATTDWRPTLARYVAREVALALLVFGLTALLGESTPGRHRGSMSHDPRAEETQSSHDAEMHPPR